MQYFGEPEGRLKIQMSNKRFIIQRLLSNKRFINKRFIIQRFCFPKILTCQGFWYFAQSGEWHDITWYLYSFCASFVLYEAVLDTNYQYLHKIIICLKTFALKVEKWKVYIVFIFPVSSIMSSRSHHSNSKISGNQSAACSSSHTRTSYCDSRCSENQNKQRKPADRSPASMGYPEECIGNYQYLSNSIMMWLVNFMGILLGIQYTPSLFQ